MAEQNEPQDDGEFEQPQGEPAEESTFSAGAADTEPEELAAEEGLIEAEGPDIETSLSDADLSFLSGQSTGEQLAAERLVDLQRVTAEYANYRKRTEANRQVEKDRAIGETVKVLLPVLDDLDRAEKHGDLTEGGPFATIAAKLRLGVEKLGLTKTGEVGEPFDPNVHEAIFQQPVPGAEASTIADVVESGYYLGGGLLRAAKVVVAVPA